MTDEDAWLTAFLATESATAPQLAGYYHHNYIVSHQGRPVVVRVPIAGGPLMDLRCIPETTVLAFLKAPPSRPRACCTPPPMGALSSIASSRAKC